MNYLDNNIESVLMEGMREKDEDLATQIQDLMFVFENLVEVDDQGIQKLLRDVPQDVLQKALKGQTIHCARRSSRTCRNVLLR